MNEFLEKLTDAEKARVEELHQQYLADAHAVQSGIAMKLNYDPTLGEPKHMRVGVTTSQADLAGLATLLLRRGVITLVEYHEALAESMRWEKERWEADLSAMYGSKVTLA